MKPEERTLVAELAGALSGVIAVADRRTDVFDRAREALAAYKSATQAPAEPVARAKAIEAALRGLLAVVDAEAEPADLNAASDAARAALAAPQAPAEPVAQEPFGWFTEWSDSDTTFHRRREVLDDIIAACAEATCPVVPLSIFTLYASPISLPVEVAQEPSAQWLVDVVDWLKTDVDHLTKVQPHSGTTASLRALLHRLEILRDAGTQ
jgi:hypothetical protein